MDIKEVKNQWGDEAAISNEAINWLIAEVERLNIESGYWVESMITTQIASASRCADIAKEVGNSSFLTTWQDACVAVLKGIKREFKL